MRLYNFFCKKCSIVFEELVENDNEVVKCKCGEIVTRILSVPRMVTETRGMFGSRKDHWRHELNAEEDMKHEYKLLEEQGKLNEVNDIEFQPSV